MRTNGAVMLIVAASVLSGAFACGSGEDASESDQGGCPAENPDCREIATDTAGAQAVQKRKCINCHTSDKGTMAGSTKSMVTSNAAVELYPPNLTPDEETGIGAWTDDQLAVAIRSGVDHESLQLCPQMTHFAEMSDFEAYSIVKYLRSLTPVKNKIPRSVCPPLKTKDEQRASQ